VADVPTEAGEIPPQDPPSVVEHEAVVRLRAEGEALRAKADAAEDRRKREQADFVNEVRRIQRQADDRVRFAVQAVVTDLLPVTDALHGAIEGLKDGEHEKRVAEGLRMVEKQLLDILGGHGVQRIDALNKPFDPAVHEAILEMESPAAARTVLQVIRPGFTLHGRVVRPAHVVVSRPPKGDGAKGAQGDGDPS
jgi:molecular chaperone GrpE